MIRMLIGLGFGILLGASAQAQVVKFNELQSPKKLSDAELRAIAEGAKVTDNAITGSVRNWENEKDGKFNAYSTNYASNSRTRRGSQGAGTWQIDDKGRYCVDIAWPSTVEKWCRFVFRVGDKLYASASDANPDGNAYEIEFKK